MNKKALWFILAMLYLFQFLILPYLLPQFYPTSNEATTILLLPLIIFSLIAPYYYDLKTIEWFLLDVFYAILIILYHGNGIYGLGMRGISLDGSSLQFSMQLLIISLCIITVILFMIQIIMKWLNRTIRK